MQGTIQNVTSLSKSRQYDQIVVDFLQNRGHLVVVTPDTQFLALLRRTLSRHICLNPDMYSTHVDVNVVVRTLRTLCAKHSVLIFVERVMHGNDMSFLVAQLKKAFPDVKLIVVSHETEKDRLVLLHEVGADNFITRPISVNGLVEKMAFTIKPLGRFGQILDQAKNMLEQNNPQRALSLCGQALEIKPDSAAACLIRGDVYLAMKNYDAARHSYEDARKGAELYLAPLQKLADLCGLCHDEDGRLRYLEDLNRLSPLNMDRKLTMGELYLNKGNNERARELFEDSVSLATREATAYVSEIANRIATAYADKDPAEAENFLRRALDLKGKMLSRDDLEVFNRLGISLRNQGKWREALQEYARALTIAPDDEHIYYNMGMACAEGKDFMRGREYMQTALRLNDRLPYKGAAVACNMGAVFCRAADRASGLPLLRIALELDPDYGLAQKILAAYDDTPPPTV